MDQDLYFTIFVGFLVVCAIVTLVWKPPKRPCPACGTKIPIENRRCPYCSYSFLASHRMR